ncbi:EF-hand domain-containing protein [Streptomyces sp. 3MP-14]|uniref:EF-hand domain-containing protein n=1 Tax=Streptomyces mimosae TaxID=2586635 RepID=A0A5N5ZXK3_9ACTN|nr:MULTISPECIES: EF-hand domain-containing protein [Streptomyces]KAB8161257.1 EF-hand domain-containing protein [Streptomyces mimosae]KAB8173059.1 EF-hand domain-containing protein [Streptomyces sp. 3MP-14]
MANNPVIDARLSKRFDKWDFDRNGVLEREDFVQEAARIARSFGKSADSPEAEALRDAFVGLFDYLSAQAGGSPTLTRDAYQQVASDLVYVQGEAAFNRALGPVVSGLVGLADQNADRLISGEEFASWLTALGLDTASAKESFQKVDTDGDGQLSEEELLTAIRQYHFGQLDVELLG